MPRRYDVSLLDKIGQGQYETDYEGVPVLVKPIPEGGDDGELDPRLYKSMRFMPLLMHFMPKPKKNATVEEQVAMPRKMFAQYKGDYVVTEGVDTRCITVNSANGSENMLESVYLQGNLSPEHIYASPLLDDFHDVPPTLLAFGEHDFLAFEDIAYARHAVKAGVRIKTIVYRGLSHGFADQIGVMPQGEDLMGEIAAMMREAL